MSNVKKSDSSIDVVFKNKGNYTNKLYARNIKFEAGKLTIDYSHYSKRKRNNLEDGDFEKLENNINNISHLMVSDDTVQNFLEKNSIKEVALITRESITSVFPVSVYEPDSGFIRLEF